MPHQARLCAPRISRAGGRGRLEPAARQKAGLRSRPYCCWMETCWKPLNRTRRRRSLRKAPSNPSGAPAVPASPQKAVRTSQIELRFSPLLPDEHAAPFSQVARRGRDDGFRIDHDLAFVVDGLTHVLLADEIHGGSARRVDGGGRCAGGRRPRSWRGDDRRRPLMLEGARLFFFG